MSNRLTELERAYFVSKVSGANPTEPLNSIKKRYWLDNYGTGSVSRGMNDMEKDWLRDIIVTNGGTPNSNYLSALYTQAVEALGGVSSKFIKENQRQIYLLDI